MQFVWSGTTTKYGLSEITGLNCNLASPAYISGVGVPVLVTPTLSSKTNVPIFYGATSRYFKDPTFCGEQQGIGLGGLR